MQTDKLTGASVPGRRVVLLHCPAAPLIVAAAATWICTERAYDSTGLKGGNCPGRGTFA